MTVEICEKCEKNPAEVLVLTDADLYGDRQEWKICLDCKQPKMVTIGYLKNMEA